MQVMASDADDPTYGSSARVVYSVLEGEQHFTVDSKTGEQHPAGLGQDTQLCLCVLGMTVSQQICASLLAAGAGYSWQGCWRGCSAALLRLLPSSMPCCSRQDLQLPAQSAWCAPALARAPLCLEQECPHRHIKLQCRRFKYYQRGLTKGCIVITRALIKGNTLN